MGSAANAIFLQSTAPIYVLVISFFVLREPLKKTDWIAMIAVLVGLSCFFFEKLGAEGWSATLIGLFSGLCFGLFLTLMRQIEGEKLAAIFWGNALCFAASLAFLKSATFQTNNLLVLCVLGVVQLALPYILYARASVNVSAFDTSLIFLLEPMLNPLWVFWALGEAPTAWALVGAAIVLTTITWRSYIESRPQTA
jgi:drug/metabolite transporter (DMT)-like permease